MLTPEVRREKALRYFTETFGEERGVPMWEDYCKKSGLLSEDAPAKKSSRPKAKSKGAKK